MKGVDIMHWGLLGFIATFGVFAAIDVVSELA